MPAEAAGKDSRCLDGRRRVETRDGLERSDRDTPLPAFPCVIVLRVAGDLDDREDCLPAGRVAESEIPSLQTRPARRGVDLEPAWVDALRQEVVSTAANEEPMLGRHPGFLTARAYAPHIRVLALLCATAALGVALAGCGDSSNSAEPGGSGSLPSPTPTTTETGGIDPMEGASTTPVEGKASGSETALLTRVAIGRHEGYDRVVFEFQNGLPGYRVSYVQPPLKEDGSGNPVQIKGDYVVMVRMEPASGFDLNTGEGVMVYKGPKRISGLSAGTGVVQELVRTGDFEAVLSWAVGLSDKVDFRVGTATSPSRLIVDFRNH